MNPKPITAASVPDLAQEAYLCEIALRLEHFVGSTLSLRSAAALAAALTSTVHLCKDGFEINSNTRTERMIGDIEAAAIAASLAAPDVTAEAVHVAVLTQSIEKEYEAMVNILTQL